MSDKIRISVERKNSSQKYTVFMDANESISNLKKKIKDSDSEIKNDAFIISFKEPDYGQIQEETMKLEEINDGKKNLIVVVYKTEELKKEEDKETTEAKKEEQNAKVKSATKEAEDVQDQAGKKLITPQIEPNKKEWNKPNYDSLIHDEGNHETGDKGTYSIDNFTDLQKLIGSWKFPQTLKVTAEGLDPVNRSGVELSKEISTEDVDGTAKLNDQQEGYYTEWELQAYKLVSNSLSSAIGFPIPKLFLTIGLSANAAWNSESDLQSQETRLYMVARRFVQKVKVVLNQDTIKLTDKVKESLKSVNDFADLKKVFQEYGYFVPTTYIIGGKIMAEKTETFSGDSRISSKIQEFGIGFKAELEKAGFTLLSAESGSKSSNKDINEESKSNSLSIHKLSLQGGDKALINNGVQWISSLTLDKWQIVGYEDLKPITDFIEDKELKAKCEKLLSRPIDKLPIEVAQEMKWMAFNAAWHAANERAGVKEDSVTNELTFKEHYNKMIKAVSNLELKLSRKTLDDIKWGAFNAAWYTANIRGNVPNDAENNRTAYEDYFNSLQNSSEVTPELAANIKNMCFFAAWHAANDRYNNKEDARNDHKRFEYYYGQIVLQIN